MQIDSKLILQFNTGLRPYQIKAKEKIYRAWDIHRSVMLQMPTGTGKTILFSAIIKEIELYYNTSKILVIAHREELIDQISSSLREKYKIDHGIIKSGVLEDRKYNVQVASIQTLTKRLNNNWEETQFNFIIIDEAHHTLASTYLEVCNKYPEAKILGVTATPYRLNAEPFFPFFNILIESQSVFSFIKDGWLSEYEYYSIDKESLVQDIIDTISIDSTGDYSEREMIRKLDREDVKSSIINSYLKYAKGKKGIVYTISRGHNISIRDKYRKLGIRAESIDSETPSADRKNIIALFRKGEVDIICNVNIFSEGFDCPDVEFIQLARPTLSLSLYLQQVGRGLRKHKGKEKVIFIDNVGLYNEFGLPSLKRMWQYYFEGKHFGVNFRNSRRIHNNRKNVSSIIYKEGSADVRLIYTSEESQIDIIDNDLYLTTSEISLIFNKGLNCLDEACYVINNLLINTKDVQEVLFHYKVTSITPDFVIKNWSAKNSNNELCIIKYDNTNSDEILSPINEYIPLQIVNTMIFEFLCKLLCIEKEKCIEKIYDPSEYYPKNRISDIYSLYENYKEDVINEIFFFLKEETDKERKSEKIRSTNINNIKNYISNHQSEQSNNSDNFKEEKFEKLGFNKSAIFAHANPNNPFYNKCFVISGLFKIDKGTLIDIIRSLGCRRHRTISSAVDFYIIGQMPNIRYICQKWLVKCS
ncbi:MAG: DEAD/DEAH box helicase family protein [Bacteroidales bacterium]